SVRRNPETIHGWRPTSVTTQPDSSAAMAAAPDSAAARRNHLVFGIRRRRHHTTANQSDRAVSAVPRPTITSQARWTGVTGGRSRAGTVSKPLMRVLTL